MAKTNKKIVVLSLCSVFILPLFLCGCWPGADLIGAYEKDVSNKKELWGGYAKGQRYILLHDIFLQRDPPETYKSENREYAGVPPEELTGGNYFRHYSAPDTIQEYLDTKEQWPLLIGVIKAGTEIECTKVLGWGTLMWPMSHSIYATVKDGPYTGKLIDIHDLSYIDNVPEDENLFVSYPNYSLLKRVPADE